ncbi:hypothetical protein IRJ41_025915, partial [Triplophysa rosa]
SGVFGADADEVKSVSVMEGHSVTLNTNETDIEIVHMILWKFGPQETLIAKINKGANKTSVYVDVLDGMFRDRLQVDDKTLTITNTRTEDSGLYQMIVKSRRETSYRFNVTVYESSSGREGALTESVKVNEGYSVTLYTNTTGVIKWRFGVELQSNDVIEWRFRNELIAKVDRGSISFFNGSDGIFIDRLKINNQTGDLTIIDFTYDLAGSYRLQITGEREITKTFSVTGTLLFVMEGESVRMNAGAPDRENYVIRWRFENSPLAELNRKTEIISTHDERFRDRLKLDDWYGSLAITNITTDLSGLYEVIVDSNSGTHTIHQSYTVTVSDEVKSVSVMEGDSVTLHTDTQIQRYDNINWDFGPQKYLLSATSGGSINVYNGRFRDRLQVDDQTGSLTITNTTTEDSGLYDVELKKRQSEQIIKKRFIVSVSDHLNQEHKRVLCTETHLVVIDLSICVIV